MAKQKLQKMAKKPRISRKQKKAAKSFATEAMARDVAHGFVSGFGLMMFGMELLRAISAPKTAADLPKEKTIDSMQDADAEIISSKIKDDATSI
jgi:hypothetical protein